MFENLNWWEIGALLLLALLIFGDRLPTVINDGLRMVRNLRNMANAGVDPDLMRAAIVARKGAGRILPFRFVAAAHACPQMEPALDEADDHDARHLVAPAAQIGDFVRLNAAGNL